MPLFLFTLSVIWAQCTSFVNVYSVYGLTILQHFRLYKSHDLCYVHVLSPLSTQQIRRCLMNDVSSFILAFLSVVKSCVKPCDFRVSCITVFQEGLK